MDKWAKMVHQIFMENESSSSIETKGKFRLNQIIGKFLKSLLKYIRMNNGEINFQYDKLNLADTHFKETFSETRHTVESYTRKKPV